MSKKLILTFILCFTSLTMGAALPSQDEANFTFTYKVEIPKPSGPFSKLQVWLPVAEDTLEQTVLDMRIDTALHFKVNKEKEFGNKILFSEITSTDKLPATIVITYRVHRVSAKSHFIADFKDQDLWQTSHFLGDNKKIPLAGTIATTAQVQTVGLTTDDEKLKCIYKYVTDSMTYNKDGTGWGQGDAVWACDNKRGNCTDFHSLLIGMARSQKIPARFEMGFPINSTQSGTIPGYHCWARAYTTKHGWIPMDSSEAKQQGKLFEYLGYLPPDRIQFSSGRDIELAPKQASGRLNYFIYPYVEIDGKKSEDYKKEFSFTRI